MPATTGRNQTSVIHLQKVVMETGVVERVRKLRGVEDSKGLDQFARERIWRRPVKEQVPTTPQTRRH